MGQNRPPLKKNFLRKFPVTQKDIGKVAGGVIRCKRGEEGERGRRGRVQLVLVWAYAQCPLWGAILGMVIPVNHLIRFASPNKLNEVVVVYASLLETC